MSRCRNCVLRVRVRRRHSDIRCPWGLARTAERGAPGHQRSPVYHDSGREDPWAAPRVEVRRADSSSEICPSSYEINPRSCRYASALGGPFWSSTRRHRRGDGDEEPGLHQESWRPPAADPPGPGAGGAALLVELKTAGHDGTRELVLEPLDFVERLAVMTPRPESDLLICHGRGVPGRPMARACVAYGRLVPDPPSSSATRPSLRRGGAPVRRARMMIHSGTARGGIRLSGSSPLRARHFASWAGSRWHVTGAGADVESERKGAGHHDTRSPVCWSGTA
jgi:hypothetical protein